MNFLIPYVVFALNLALFMGCSDDVIKPPPPDPCAGKKPVSAAFEIIEPPGDSPYWVKYDADTILSQDAIFKAIERNADSYEWEIGADILTTRDVVRQSFPRGETIAIRLIVHKKPDSVCFPTDDGIDTVTRYLYVVPIIDGQNREYFSPMEGKFLGKYDDTPDESQTIKVNPFCLYPGSGGRVWEFGMFDFPKPGCDLIYGPTKSAYKQRQFWYGGVSSDDCKAPGGIIYVHGKNNDSVLIHYEEFRPVRPKDSLRPVRIFRGVRIQ